MSIKNCNDTIANRTRDLLVCSAAIIIIIIIITIIIIIIYCFKIFVIFTTKQVIQPSNCGAQPFMRS